MRNRARRLGAKQHGVYLGMLLVLSLLLIFSATFKNTVFTPSLKRRFLHGWRRSGAAAELGGHNVLVAGQPRSGTSYLSAQLAAQNPDAVYWFEPLWRLGIRGVAEPGIAETLTRSLLHCAFPNDTNGYEIRPAGIWQGNSFLHKVSQGPFTDHENDNATLIAHACVKSNLRVIKYVRLSIATLGRILEESPSLRAIYVVRDPRATALSQLKAFFNNVPNRRMNQTIYACQRQMQDWQELQQLAAPIRDRMLVLRYEDLVRQPEQELRYVYGWLGLEYTDSANEFLYHYKNCTRGSDTYSHCVGDWSPKRTLQRWRWNLTNHWVDRITIECAETLKLFYADP